MSPEKIKYSIHFEINNFGIIKSFIFPINEKAEIYFFTHFYFFVQIIINETLLYFRNSMSIEIP